jgi:hypothetical protein
VREAQRPPLEISCLLCGILEFLGGFNSPRTGVSDFPFYFVRSSMLDNEGRRVKARHDVTQFYQRRKIVSRRELPRADMTIEDNLSLAREEESSEDDDVEDDTYMPSPWAPIHGRGKVLASGSGAVEIQEEEEEEEEEEEGEEEETFDVEEITPTSYVHMGNPVFR